MINSIVFPDGRKYTCDNCKKVVMKFKSYTAARAAGWAISYSRDKCYCPNCAPFFRHTGNGKPRTLISKII